MQMLKDHIKKVRNWIFKLERLERGATSVTALNELLPEAENFLIDISPNVDSILHVTQVYCFCRLPFHGVMVGCDTPGCEDWLHIDCIGMTKAQVSCLYVALIEGADTNIWQADKVGTYTCLRCNIKSSFAASYAGTTPTSHCL